MSIVLHDDRLPWVVFTVASSPSPLASEGKSDDGFGSEDADEDDGTSSPSDDEMFT